MKQILLVESHQPVEGLSSSLFRRQECTLAVASSGAEALDRAAREKPDLIIYDDRSEDMPPEDFVLALHASEAGPEIPVIVLAGPVTDDEAGALLRAGASAVLERPADDVELNAKICELLGISLRRHVRTFVKMKVDATTGSSTHFATISNISLGGVLIESERTLRLGDILKLSFFLPEDDDPITVISKVVRVSDPGARAYGCQFLDLSDAARDRIHDFVTDAAGD